jgi:ArsR family transcriptional regulator
MTKSSISHQLNKLKAAGFVKCEKVGKQVFYSLDDDHIFELFDISLRHLHHKVVGRDEK